MNRIEGGVGVLERPKTDTHIDLYTTALDSRDPEVIGREYDELRNKANGHGIDAFNNFFTHFKVKDRKHNMFFREQDREYGDDYFEERNKQTFRELGKSSPHSDFYLDKPRGKFFKEFDDAAEHAGINIQEDMENHLAGSRGTDEIYANDKIKAAYVELRQLGYTHHDLTE